MELYSMRSTHNGYRMVKFNEDLNVLATYDMPTFAGRLGCSCFQSSKPTCRHRQMAQIFLTFGRVDTGWFLNYEDLEWQPPLVESERPMWRRI